MNIKLIETISAVLGWIYVVCWSISFYPQAWLNFSRKSVTGLSIDFVVASVIGFVCYSIFTVSMYFIPSIKREYRERNKGQDNLIAINDVFFAVHALVLTSIYMVQKKEEKLSKLGAVSMIGVGVLFVVLISLCSANKYSWLDFIYVMSYLKLVLTILKYIPQVHMNYVLKSTVGWHVQNVILDFIGGVLSITQLLMDAFSKGDVSGIKGISAKLILGLVSIVFDIIFMLQHYVWYPESGHQRVVIQVGKTSELASPAHGNASGKASPFKLSVPPGELEAQTNATEARARSA